MKIFLSLLFVATSILGLGQNIKGESVITADIGYSLAGRLIKNLIDVGNLDTEIKTSITPVVMVGMDHALSDFFSIGVQGAYQQIGADFEYQYKQGNTLIKEYVETNINRINIAIRPNIHYGSSESVDLYSGIRVGVQSFGTSNNSKDPNFSALNKLKSARLSLGLTVFGFRYFITDNFGVNTELSFGTPYAIIGGLNIKF